MKKTCFTKFLQKILKNANQQPIKYWLFHQSPCWISNLAWKYDDLKYEITCRLENYFTYYPDYVEGYVVSRDKTGIWVGWSDEDTFIPSSNKKWIKLFDGIECGDTFQCKIKWDPIHDQLYKIKDVKLLKSRKEFDKWCNDKKDIV